jgi:hypothetical protein
MPMILRRCLIVLSGGALVALSAAAGPAHASIAAPSTAEHAAPADATITPATPTNTPDLATGPATMTVTINNVYLHCFTPGIIYSVNANGIHIRALPDGSIETSIGKGRWFDSNVMINGAGPYHCITNTTVANQYWVFGYPNYDSSISGYVGLDYLNFVKYD